MWKRECARLDLDRRPVLTQAQPPLSDVTPIQGANGKLSFSDADVERIFKHHPELAEETPNRRGHKLHSWVS